MKGTKQHFSRQVQAHLRKNLIEKKRNGCVTFCECFSHLFIMLLLAWGFSLSIISKIGDKDYSTIDLSVPPPFFTRTSSSNDSASLQQQQEPQIDFLELVKTVDDAIRGPIRVPTLETFLDLGVQTRTALGAGSSFPFQLFASTSYGQKLRNVIYKGSLHFAPAGAATDSLITHMKANAPTIESASYTIRVHENEAAAIEYVLDNPYRNVLALIVLHEVTPYKVNYELRMQYEALPNTNRILRRSNLGFGSEYQEYFYSGFFSIADAVDSWAWEYTGSVPFSLANTTTDPEAFAAYVDPTRTSSGGDVGDDGLLPQQGSEQCTMPEPFLFPFPVREYDQNPFYNRVGYLLGLGLVMATLYPTSRLTKGLVEEKETKLREVMKIMGLSDSALQLSWLITGAVLFMWIACTSTLATTTSFIKSSDKGIIFLFFALFCLSEVLLSMLLATFFSNSKLASIAAPALLFSTILPRYIFFNTVDEELWIQKYFTSLLSPSAFAFGADTIAQYEYSNIGLQWSNIEDGMFSFGGTLRMLALDCVLYGLLALYLEMVLPNE
jgi:ATP-binding cassette subfamily A (ABC1) protein 3